MPAPASRAQDIAARLTAAGYEPHVHRRLTRIHVVTKVPDEPSPARWQALLAALDRADRFGLRGNEHGLTAWALVWTMPGRTAPNRRDEDVRP